ncbi:bacillithiol biosynthesis cysteine-adding enzyme BshC [Macrococcoides caseolyticum]|uniref:bacillithiol biosynthesis cysteine-adding enzyme BshC n=1 Tax=Macrococcoides caseolyticum TaxID=69966 RepID=UPI001F428234|nr:bacillithiol biosynthesis cysteine-adding enzyme BshC [Macrococcus caseolyticus]MCE4956877.1 bacillithiol biosynthesis cysteine-adding enzyme BshC [Macrococcus caseolyticus]
MEIIKRLADKKGAFIERYTNQDAVLNQYLYDVTKDESYKARMNYPANGLEAKLAEVIEAYMSKFELSTEQRENLKRLSTGHKVVIGGQQAGLFVSPMYTIHKIISIIVLAKTQSKHLKTDIIPVFWIAGEDHDFDEVNHVNVYSSDRHLHKIKYHPTEDVTDSVSTLEFEQEALKFTIDRFISSLTESQSTKAIHELLNTLPTNWTDHFHYIIHTLFKDYGLLFIDSQNKALRALETDQLVWMFDNHEAIDKAFRSGQEKMKALIEEQQIMTDTNVHLFMSYDGKRQLLKYVDGKYVLPKSDVTFTKAEIRAKIQAAPHLFSNNVVTRPLMEEKIFNTLAFIGGPSEIKYWGELKQVFQFAHVEMPPVVPRMRITYANDKVLKDMQRFRITFEDLFERGIESFQNEYLVSKENALLLSQMQVTVMNLEKDYEAMQLLNVSSDTKQLLQDNLSYHKRQFEYFKKRYQQEIKRCHDIDFKALNAIGNVLYPDNGLQERLMHPLQFINTYHFGIFDEVLEELQEYSLDHIIMKP